MDNENKELESTKKDKIIEFIDKRIFYLLGISYLLRV